MRKVAVRQSGWPDAPQQSASRWLRTLHAGQEPRVRLICFPHAGGSASFYRSWAAHMPAGVELSAACYPGREDRLLDPPAVSMDELTAPLARAVAAEADGVPVAFFGHSMGGLVAYETALRLSATGGPKLAALFVSAYADPGRRPSRALANAGDEELVLELTQLGGSDAAALEHPELRDLILPVVRADYRLLEDYVAPPVRTVGAPLTAYYGRQDDALAADHGSQDDAPPPDTMAPWSEATSSSFSIRTFDGGHFYLVEHVRDLVADVLTRLGAPSAEQ
ncbi:thioesterase II family protein [Actinacidiphila glaucinigra]|uniref:thioesterase II family protein n=1 Tax=Actinacidiphila glaucinigra TaxID=235986 RepID=UPI0035D71640